MSGIVGICNNPDPSSYRAQLSGMASRLQHRTSCGVDVHVASGFGIAQLKSDLNRTSSSAELQELVGYLDGRLDNRRELSDLLGIPDSTVTDSQLAIHAYRKWNTKCVQYLLGDFVCVIWDTRKQALYCARDHMGVRPFYYYHDPKQFAFASESAAFASLQAVRLSINNTRIADYLLGYEYADFESTFFSEVKRLPPAHYLIANGDGVSIHRYWSLDSLSPLQLPNNDEYQQAFREVLHEAVACRLDPEKNTACLLSGGIDSAAITVSALQQSERIQIHSAVSEDDADTRHIHQFQDHLSCEVSEYTAESLAHREHEVNAAMRALDDPFAASGAMLMALYLGAKESGCRVVLDGVEGDQIVSLPSDYAVLLLRQRKFRIALREITKQAGIYNENKLHAMFIAVRAALIPYRLRAELRKLRFPNVLAASIEEWPTDAKQINHDLQARYRNLYAPDPLTFKNQLTLKLSLLNLPYIAVALERYDKTAAVCGVEARHPLLDKRVVEFCCRLPWDQQVRNGWSKWILRKSFDTHLPKGLAWRADRPHLGPEFTAALSRARRSDYTHLPKGLPELLDSRKLTSLMHNQLDELDHLESQWLLHSLLHWYEKTTGSSDNFQNASL